MNRIAKIPVQETQTISTRSSGRITRRRSLLRGNAVREERTLPLWRLLLNGFSVAVTLYLVWIFVEHLSGNLETISTAMLFRSIWPIALLVTLITVLGYTATTRLERFSDRLSDRGIRMARVSIWLMSGIIGSLIGYEILHLVRHGILGLDSVIVTTTLKANAVIVLVVSTAGAIISSRRRGRLRHRQDKLLTDEFEAAHKMQQSLLPDSDARIHGFDISGAMSPAVEVGGDYYDYLSFADGAKGILVADASGKGIPAALVMAKFQGMAQALSIHVPNIEEFFVGLNDTLRVRLDRKSFITVGMMTIDFDNRCRFWRAGHNPLLHFVASTGEVVERKPAGIGLGLAHGGLLGSSLQPEEFDMAPNDVVLLYSDGLTEAMNTSDELFGEERLTEALVRHSATGGAQEIMQAILNDLARFADGTDEQHDDVTLVVVKRV